MADIVYVVGLGPGDPQFLTAQAKTALENADVLCGYTVYIDLIFWSTGPSKATSR